MGKKKKHSGEIYLTPRKDEAERLCDEEEQIEKGKGNVYGTFSEEMKNDDGKGEEIVEAKSADQVAVTQPTVVELGETEVEKNIYTGHGLGKKIKFVGEYDANNSGKPMDVQTVSYSASHLVLGENERTTRTPP